MRIVDRLRRSCRRAARGKCNLASCLERGGWVPNEGKPDPYVATCDVFEDYTYVHKLEEKVRCLIDNDPDADAADGVSVLDVWRKDARELLERGK